MKNNYVKPESLAMDCLPLSCLCAASDIKGSTEDYILDSEYNFFGD